jgi:hypothetical protein
MSDRRKQNQHDQVEEHNPSSHWLAHERAGQSGPIKRIDQIIRLA